jgi:hypothetical protein
VKMKKVKCLRTRRGNLCDRRLLLIHNTVHPTLYTIIH